MVHHAENGPWYLLPRPFSCAKICCRLDRRQAVRHWVLVPAFAGSNPAGPAIFCLTKNGRQDESPRFVQCPVACDDGALFISCRSTFSAVKKAPLGRLALGLIVVTISSPIGIVRCGTAVRFEFAMKHGVVLFAHSAGRCGCLLLVGFV